MSNLVYVVDHGVGNTVAISNILRKIGVGVVKVRNSSELMSVDYAKSPFILPGVGSFDAGMQSLMDSGLSKLLINHANSGGKLMGICLGMELLCDSSEEGDLEGLGIISGRIVKLNGTQEKRVPHVGWAEVKKITEDPIFEGIKTQRFYHNHSYGLPSGSPFEIARLEYSDEYVVGLRKGNVVGLQFHPEKSHSDGERIFINFLAQ
jgi:glutamine amidotransferase